MQGHPYRNVLDLRHGASTSLIELEFASHTGKDSDTDPGVPAGLPFYTLKAQLRELELVFLNRFMQVRAHLFQTILKWVSSYPDSSQCSWQALSLANELGQVVPI